MAYWKVVLTKILTSSRSSTTWKRHAQRNKMSNESDIPEYSTHVVHDLQERNHFYSGIDLHIHLR